MCSETTDRELQWKHPQKATVGHRRLPFPVHNKYVLGSQLPDARCDVRPTPTAVASERDDEREPLHVVRYSSRTGRTDHLTTLIAAMTLVSIVDTAQARSVCEVRMMRTTRAETYGPLPP